MSGAVAPMMRRRPTTTVERNAPRPDPERKQAPNGKLGAERPSSDQPAAAGSASSAASTCSARCRRGAGDPPSGLQASTARAGARRAGRATGMDCLASACERGCAEAPWQEHWRQGGGETA